MTFQSDASSINLAVAQFKPEKGNYRANLTRLKHTLNSIAAHRPLADVLCLPETALTGYFLEGGVRELAVSIEQLAEDIFGVFAESDLYPIVSEAIQAAEEGDDDGKPKVQIKAYEPQSGLESNSDTDDNSAWDALDSEDIPLQVQSNTFDIVLGFYELHENTIYNSAAYLALSDEGIDVLHIHRKMFLPTYGVFDESRFVEPGLTIQSFNTRWGRAAILVCEDAWHSITATTAAVGGAQILFVPSASPARGATIEGGDSSLSGSSPTSSPNIVATSLSAPKSVERWERIATSRSEENGVFTVVTQLVGNEGGKTFGGGSMIVGPSGDLRAKAPLWDEGIIPATIEFADISRARAETPLLADLRAMLPHVMDSLILAGDLTGNAAHKHPDNDDQDDHHHHHGHSCGADGDCEDCDEYDEDVDDIDEDDDEYDPEVDDVSDDDEPHNRNSPNTKTDGAR